MSEGPRIPLADANRIVTRLFERWSLNAQACMVVGSIRRQRPDVGDIEFIAPAVSKNAQDPLYERILATVINPPAPTSIFGQTLTPPADAFALALEGLKPGFLACKLTITAWGRLTVPVQIYRYTAENLGWMLIERTGPWNFGRWFLTRWKMQHSIPQNDPRFKASINNHLVDLDQKTVEVATEEIAFKRCGINPVPPEHRDAFIQRVEAAAAANRARRTA